MNNNDGWIEKATDFRKRAEAICGERPIPAPESLKDITPEESQRLLQELRIRQIELEMQNDELRRTQAELDTMRQHYLDLYDLAPVGYVTVSEQGLILEANLTAAGFLGDTGGALVDQPLSRFTLPDDQDLFHRYRRQLFATGEKQAWEMRMVPKDGMPFWVHLQARVAKDAGGAPMCWLVMSDITERKNVEKALHDSEEKFAKIYYLSPDAIDLTDLETGVQLEVNQNYLKMVGYTREELIGHSTLPGDLSIWTDMEDRNRLLVGLKEHGEILEFETLLHRKDGTVFTCLISSSLLEIAGKAYKLSIRRDISERNKAEETLRENVAKNRALIEAIPDIIFTFSRTGEYLDIISPNKSLLLMPAEKILNQNIFDILPGPRAELWLNAIEKTLDLKVVQELEYSLLIAGEEKIFEARIAPSTNDKVVAIVRDITERKLTENALHESDRMLQESQRVAHIGAYECTLTATEFGSNTWQASSEIYKIFGIDTTYPHTLDGWAGCVHQDAKEEEVAYLKQKVNEGISFDHQYRIMRVNDGKECWVHGIGGFEFDRNSIPIKIIGTIQDITERKLTEIATTQLQAQFQQSQKMESMGVLAGGVAHDMNNVLGAILGLASAFVEIQPEGTPAHGAFNTILKAATRGGALAKSLLVFARQNLPSEQELDLNEIVQDEVRILAHTTLAKIHLQMELAPDLRHILGDVGSLTHAFMNLCVNAVDAMPEQGTLTLRTRNVDNDWAEVVVEDDGTGMTEEVLAKAMDPFFTTKGVGKGTGLGLSMVYTTVRAHHGQLDIQSEPSRGTRVRIRFPACETLAQEPGPVAKPQSLPSTGALSVLLVDDDELIQNSMQAILAVLGHRVTATLSGEDALGELEAGLQPDVVIMDMNMPGLGGAGTLPRLRALLPKVPVLLSTGRVDQTTLDLVSVYPGVTLMSKPFSMRELQEQLAILSLG